MNIGDEVSWTHITHRGSSIILLAWEGVVVGLTDAQATVKRKNRTYTLSLKRLRPINQTPELTELVMGKRDGGERD